MHHPMKECSQNSPAIRPRLIRGGPRGAVAFRRLFLLCAVACHALWSSAQTNGQTSTTLPSGRIIHGVAKSGNMPIPGAGISATNAATKQQVSTSTDVDGSYSLRIPADGRYTVRVEMPAFAASSQEVVLDETHSNVQANFELILQSRARQAGTEQRRASASGRGFQNLSVFQNAAGQDGSTGSLNDIAPAGMPVPGIAPNSATESVAVSGNTSNSFNAMSADEMQQRFNDARQQGEGFGGGLGGGPGGGRFGGGGFGGGGGGGVMIFGRRGFDINRPHGSLYYGVGDSALNASPFELTGQPPENPSYLQNSFGGSVGGPLNIPHIYNGGSKTFYFINFNGRLGEVPYDQFSTVPTLLERQGNFSQSTYTSGASIGLPVKIFNPATNMPYPGDTLPTINPIAQGLLQYIPLPNLPGNFENFRSVTTTTSDSDDLNVRINRSFGAAPVRGRRGGGGGRRGPQNNLSIGFHYHQTSANITNPFPSVGGTTTVRSFDIPLSYTRSIGKLTNIVRFDFNRNRSRAQNLYAFKTDVTGALGIGGVATNPFDWGLPNLAFSNFASLSDATPAVTRNQTFTYSYNAIYTHGKHTGRWGGDFRRVQVNVESDTNPRGSFAFSGLNTSQIIGPNQSLYGYDFADFLLGLPQQTSEEFGQNPHLRGNYWDMYAQDEWKVRANLTLNLGVRYEYVSPLSEINNRLANLDVSPEIFSAEVVDSLTGTQQLPQSVVAPVQPGQAGPFSGKLPDSLLRPDRNNFAPRLGLAWKPFSKTVVRAGYGINYNTGAYQSIAQQLALQPPFSTTATDVESITQAIAPPYTLQNGFPAIAGITNDYAVNPNYRLGYVQIRNLDIQQQIRPTLLLNIDYTGTKGTNLDVLEAPNRTATGILISSVQAFTYESAVADSEANAGSVRFFKRFTKGFSAGGTYTFSKALDDASSIGAGATSGAGSRGLGAGGTGSIGGGGGSSSGTASAGASNLAQNPLDLSAERGLSSFNQTHKFTADYLLELPFGHDKRWLTGNTPLRAIFGDWQWSGDWTIASGLPFTPQVANGQSDLARGTNGTIRANVVPGQSVSLPHPTIGEWFNTAAFLAPPTGQYGDARRNSIIGPGTKLFDMAFTKIVPLKESRMLEFRAQATNIFNIPNYSSIGTVVNSPTFGHVTAVGAMRQFTMTARFRF
jgi:hypothetical protein